VIGVGSEIVSETARLSVKIVPGAAQNKIVGWLGEALKIRVRAQPEKGKANIAVVAILADSLDISAGSISVCYGNKSKTKVIEIRGMSNAELRQKLSSLAT
jgi:uncharacterized protein